MIRYFWENQILSNDNKKRNHIRHPETRGNYEKTEIVTVNDWNAIGESSSQKYKKLSRKETDLGISNYNFRKAKVIIDLIQIKNFQIPWSDKRYL